MTVEKIEVRIDAGNNLYVDCFIQLIETLQKGAFRLNCVENKIEFILIRLSQ